MRRAGAGLLALSLLSACAGGEKRPTFDDLPKVSRVFEQQLVTARKVDGLRMTIYECGSVTAPGGAVSELKSWAARTKLDIPAFLVKHPTKGYVLFDTGLHPDMETIPEKKMGRIAYFFVPFKAGPGQNIAAQLEAAGVKRDEVRTVVVSHLHLDHAGMVDAFPKATVLIDRREWDHQRGKFEAKKKPAAYEFDPVSAEPNLRLRLIDLSSAPAYASFDHGIDLFNDGSLVLLDLSGHTPGNMGLWVNLDSGPVLLAGDATWILDNHQDLALPIKADIHDLRTYWRRLFQMQEAQKALPKLVIFPGHDLAPLKLQPRPDVELAPYPRG